MEPGKNRTPVQLQKIPRNTTILTRAQRRAQRALLQPRGRAGIGLGARIFGG